MTKTTEELSKMPDIGVCKEILVSEIKPSKLNPREQNEPVDSDDFVELCDSIMANGLIEPIIVRKSLHDHGGYEAIAGTRRLRALKHLGVKEAPTVLRKMDDNDVRIASLVENIHRKGLEFEEKKTQLEQIYKAAGFKDYDEVAKYLYRINNQRHRKTKTARFTSNPVPDAFEVLADRIGYSMVRQANILRGITDERRAVDRNYIPELYDEPRKMVESHPVLKQHPQIQQQVAFRARHKAPVKVRKNYRANGA